MMSVFKTQQAILACSLVCSKLYIISGPPFSAQISQLGFELFEGSKLFKPLPCSAFYLRESKIERTTFDGSLLWLWAYISSTYPKALDYRRWLSLCLRVL